MTATSTAGMGRLESSSSQDRHADGIQALLDPGAYAAYRRRQATALLELIPREAIREVYGHARKWARERGVYDEKDPLETLRRFCEAILPLPPFHVWREDAGRSPDLHLDELDRAPSGENPLEGSVPVEVRTFTVGETTWYASLSLFQAGGAWKGFLTFHRGPESRMLRTTAIFREDDPAEVRVRFRAFDDHSLRAFLRSIRP